jgi:hypothetical protein
VAAGLWCVVSVRMWPKLQRNTYLIIVMHVHRVIPSDTRLMIGFDPLRGTTLARCRNRRRRSDDPMLRHSREPRAGTWQGTWRLRAHQSWRRIISPPLLFSARRAQKSERRNLSAPDTRHSMATAGAGVPAEATASVPAGMLGVWNVDLKRSDGVCDSPSRCKAGRTPSRVRDRPLIKRAVGAL